jgi:hypothetical protein
MRRLTAVALAALTALSLQGGPSAAQPQDSGRAWRGDQAPDDRWYDRDDFERRGRNDIDCPLSQVRREVTSQLPEGWWNTPSVDYLSGTEVQTIGGRRTLVCKYGQSGQIMRLEPRRRDCTPRRGGFDCRRQRQGNWPGGPGGPGNGNPGPFPPDPYRPGGNRPGEVFYSGRVDVRQTYQVDFDTGRVGAGVGDLWFHAETQNDLYLEPVNGTRLAWGGSEDRGFQGCRDADLRNERITLARLNVGTYLCYRTDQGRIGQMRVEGFRNDGGGRTISLSFETYASR